MDIVYQQIYHVKSVKSKIVNNALSLLIIQLVYYVCLIMNLNPINVYFVQIIVIVMMATIMIGIN